VKEGDKNMKDKVSVSKSIAVLLCIITMTISFNIYSSYKTLYISDNLTRDTIIYTAFAKTPLKNLALSDSDTESSLVKVNGNNSTISLDKEDIEQKIFINILILFLSFISLASIHNFVLCTESNKGHNSKNPLNSVANKAHSINPTPSKVSKEGVR